MAASLLGIFTGADAGAAEVTTSSRTTTSGSLVTGCGAHWNSSGGATVAITSSLAGTYTEPQELEFGAFTNMALAYNIGGTRGASHTITSTTNLGNSSSVTAQEWDGIEASPTVASATATGTSTAPSVSVAVGASSLAAGMVCYDGSPTTIAPNGATEASEQDENNDRQAQNVSYKTAQTGTPSIAWTLGASTPWGAIIATFTESGGAAATSLLIPPRPMAALLVR